MKKIFVYISLLLMIAVLSAFLYANYKIHEKIELKAPITITIPKGSGISKIIAILNEKGFAKPDWLYKVYTKYLSMVEKKYIQAGVYRFTQNISTQEIIESLFDGKNLYIARTTIPEGLYYTDFASILKRDALVDSLEFVRLATSDSLLKARKISGKNVDGYLLPDTYDIYMESKAADVIDKLLNQHEKIYSRILSQSANPYNLSKKDILILASIVEAETPDDDERNRVAGLYQNRLNKNMLLQADPTVAYALGGKRKLTLNDLKYDSPYNTYKYLGLPPTPINNPGPKSIRAALNPEKHNYLYMVTIGDGTKRHNFAETYSEHLKYVAEFRRRRNAASN